MVERSLPQIPARRGRRWTHSGPGRSGGSTSSRRSGPYARPGSPGATDPATRAAAKRASFRSMRSAFIAAALASAARPSTEARRWRADSSGPMGRIGRGPPGAFDHCSTSQPRLRAMAASRVSGLTATGKPTASSIGRSEVESA